MKSRIRNLMKEGKRFSLPYFTLYFRSSPSFKMGFIVSKKIARPTKRNYVKRLIRHFWREKFKEGDFLFVFKKEITEAGKDRILESLNKVAEEIKCQNF